MYLLKKPPIPNSTKEEAYSANTIDKKGPESSFLSIKAQASTILTELNKTKAAGFKSLRVNYWEITQVTLKCPMEFLDKTCKNNLQQKK